MIGLRRPASRGRRAYTLVEIMVASAVFLVAVITAIGTTYQSKQAGERTERVDEYREVRIIFNRIARDLQEASRLKLPAYDYHSYKLVMMDVEDREVVYSLKDAAGEEQAAEPAADDARIFRVVRAVTDAGKTEPETIKQTGGIRWMRFTRLGERLVGVTIQMQKKEEQRPGGTYTVTMSVNRVML